MKNLFGASLIIFAGIAAVGCVKQDPDLEDCETGIRLLFDWITPASPRDGTTTLSVDITGNDTRMSTSSPIGGRDLEILPGLYRFTAWESAANITVDGTMVTLASSEGVASEPQQFTAGTTTDTVENSEEYQEIHVPMYQQTRDLIIRLRFTGDGISLIRRASGSMSGVALSRDVVYGFPPVDGRLRPVAVTDGSMPYTFTEGTDGWFTGRRTLLGIDGDNDQYFTVTVGFDQDLSTTETVELTSHVNGFHTVDVDEPWVISITLDIGASFDMTIVDWNSGSQSWLDAQ